MNRWFQYALTLLIGFGIPALLFATNWNLAPIVQGNTAAITPISGSAQAAATQVVATLSGTAGKTTYIEGFTITGSGSTAANVVNVTVGGTTNTLNYVFTFPAGVAAAATALDVRFPTPMPASAPNTAITVTVPAAGSGNTNQAVSAYGFQQ